MNSTLEGALGADRSNDEEILRRLHVRLATAARAEGVLDLSYRIWDSPVGPLLLAGTPVGLVRIAFAEQDHDRVLDDLAHRIGPRILADDRQLDPAVRELEEYFAGTRRHFDVPLDHRLTSGFRADVLAQLPLIGYGRTASYAHVAQAAGNPRAVRAVGSACGANPLPIVVPCHRVVRSDGSLGGYAGGLDAKKVLLALESANG